MSSSTAARASVRVLSLDGGGIRGLAELIVLKDIFERMNHVRATQKLPSQEPWEVFDIIGGTSTGGLIAVMLGRLKNTIDECIEKYLQLSAKAFTSKFQWKPHRAHYHTDILEAAIKFVVGPEEALKDPDADPACKVFVVAHAENTSTTAVFRTYYNVRGGDNHLLNNTQLWQACRATSAAMTFFEPIVIGKDRFSDGGLLKNNPINQAYSEAREMFPNRPMEVLSLGAGVEKPKEFNPGLLSAAGQLGRLGTETRKTASDFKRAHAGTNLPYFRFDPPFVGDIGLDKAERLDDVRRWTSTYIEEQTDELLKCAQTLAVPADHTSETAGRDFHFSQEACENCLKDLSLTDPTEDLQMARDFSPYSKMAKNRDDRPPDTCHWIESDDSYQAWDQAPAPALLWVRGEPGIGKTFLSTHLLENVLPRQLPATRLAYFLCNNPDPKRNNAVAILRGLLWLLLDRNHDLYKHFQKDHSSKSTECFKEQGTLWPIFRAVVMSFLSNDAYLCIHIDALDECEMESRKWLCGKLKELLCSESVHLKVILTSRKTDDMKDLYKNCKTSTCARYKIEMSTSKIGEDLTRFIEHEIGHYAETGQRKHWNQGRLPKNRGWSEERAKKVHKNLMSSHGGTFLWVSLVLDSLARVEHWEVLTELERFPKELLKVYQLILSDIKEKRDGELARHILHLVLSATAPMSLNRLALALYFRRKEREHLPKQDRIQDYRDIIKSYGLLLRMDGDREKNQVTVIHQSVKDFMTGNDVSEFWHYISADGAAEEMFEQICMNYLGTKEFKCVSKDALRIHEETADLTDASKSWPPVELKVPPHRSWSVLAGTIDLLDYFMDSFPKSYKRIVSTKHQKLFHKVYNLSPFSRAKERDDVGIPLGDGGPRHIMWRLMTIALRKTYNDVLLVICTLCRPPKDFKLDHCAFRPAWCPGRFLFDLLSTTVVSGNPAAAKTLATWYKSSGSRCLHPKDDSWSQSWFDVDWKMPDCYHQLPASRSISQRIAAFDALVLGLSGCETPLHIMVKTSKTSAIQRIFDDNNRDHPDRRGDLLIVQDDQGYTPLGLAIQHGEFKCAQLLIRMDRAQRSFQVRDRWGSLPFHLYLARAEDAEELADVFGNLQQNCIYARDGREQVLLHITAAWSARLTKSLIKADLERETYMGER